jgi:hypothetical protein
MRRTTWISYGRMRWCLTPSCVTVGSPEEEVVMLVESTERPIPFTSNRALTELVQSRQQLDGARRSLELALEIFRGLAMAPVPLSPLQEVLAQMERAEATLWEAAQ